MKSIISPPKTPAVTNPFTSFLDYLVRWIKSERVEIRGWPCEQRADGKYYNPPNVTPTPAAAASGGWNYRGAWTAGSYNVNDVVQMGGGTSAGMYLCLTASNANAPDSGIGWVQTSTSAGTWQ